MKTTRLTIYDIKKLTAETAPKFFSPSNMRHAHQRMKDFKVYKQKDGTYYITAPQRDADGTQHGYTERFFDPKTNALLYKRFTDEI